MPDEFILVATDNESDIPDAPTTGSKNAWGNEVQRRLETVGVKRLNVAELEQKMGNFLQVVGRLFRQAEAQAQTEQVAQAKLQAQTGQVVPKSRLKLDEVELSVEITGSGEIKLVAGGKAEAKGAIKLKFKRVEG
jgi:hypothetical protein